MIASSFIRNPIRTRGGFTLIEVIVTLTIFILLTAAVFGIMTAVFQGSNDLQDNQNRRDEVSALHAYLKNDFENLAASDHMQTYRRGTGDGLRVNGVLLVTQGNTFALDAEPQSNGLYVLRLGRPTPDRDPNPTVASFTQELEKNQSALTWTPMIRDVKSIAWQFQSASSPDWQKEWLADPAKPTLVECSIQLAGDQAPVTMDFLVPHVVAPGSQAIPTVAPAVAHAP